MSDMSSREDLPDLLLLQAYIDGELDAADALDFERRMARNKDLASEYDRHRALRSAIAAHLRKEPVPEQFAHRLVRLASPRGEAWGEQRFDWRALAASILVTAGLSGSLTYYASRPDASYIMAGDILADHQRAMLAQDPVDVVSSDRHTVKPWFSQKLALSPPVVDLASDGFPLIGGRIDFVGGNPAPALVYRHLEHLISLTIITDKQGDTAPRALTRNGYNMVTWQSGDFTYWAVSNIEANELSLFVSRIRAALTQT